MSRVAFKEMEIWMKLIWVPIFILLFRLVDESPDPIDLNNVNVATHFET